ncbi:MAG: tetratricopeptide repeat protein [Cardiobacteriaceae bacterium]|nr:tetratricopeptide repeat protein [Cardiobacteriaceae bacterium]
MTDRTDEETVDLIRDWLRQYGLTVAGGLGLGIAGIFAYEWWQGSQARAAQEQAVQMQAVQQAVQAGKHEEAQALFAKMGDAKGEMAEMTAMLVAKAQMQAGDKSAAKAHLEKAAAAKDAFVAQTARWHLAQLAAADGQWDDVLGQVQALQTSIYAVPALELKALAHRAKNEPEQALAALEDAQSRMPSPFLEVQIQALKQQLLTRDASS